MRRVAIAVLAPLLLASLALAGPIYAPETLDHYFGLDWRSATTARGPVVEGFIYNRSGLIADRMRLSVHQLDATGNVAMRLGDISANPPEAYHCRPAPRALASAVRRIGRSQGRRIQVVHPARERNGAGFPIGN